MGLRELAEKDLAHTLENVSTGTAIPLLFLDGAGNPWECVGTVGDIGFLLDTDGNPVSGRTIVASWRLSSMMVDGKPVEPGRGWGLCYRDLTGRRWNLYVTRFEPDRTIGIGRVWLSLGGGNNASIVEPEDE